MLKFLNMAENYEEISINRYENKELVVSTACVIDSLDPYETAIKHPNYNKGDFVIVEQYATREDAEKGHEKWVKIMTAPSLPDQLEDVSTCQVAQLAAIMSSK